MGNLSDNGNKREVFFDTLRVLIETCATHRTLRVLAETCATHRTLRILCVPRLSPYEHKNKSRLENKFSTCFIFMFACLNANAPIF